jgi:hypothetical protein
MSIHKRIIVMKPTITKEKVMEAINRALAQKEETLKFLKGEITKEELEAKGVKLAKPL